MAIETSNLSLVAAGKTHRHDVPRRGPYQVADKPGKLVPGAQSPCPAFQLGGVNPAHDWCATPEGACSRDWTWSPAVVTERRAASQRRWSRPRGALDQRASRRSQFMPYTSRDFAIRGKRSNRKFHTTLLEYCVVNVHPLRIHSPECVSDCKARPSSSSMASPGHWRAVSGGERRGHFIMIWLSPLH
jgi:hypothetical protein